MKHVRNAEIGGEGNKPEKAFILSRKLLMAVARLDIHENATQAESLETLRREGLLDHGSMHTIGDLEKAARKWLYEEEAKREKKRREPTDETALAERLVEKFKLLDARVVPGGGTYEASEYQPLLSKYGEAAAEYFEDYADMTPDLNVSVSGGQSILDMMSSLTDRQRPHVKFYSAAMIGRGEMNRSAYVGPETNASLAWAKSGRIPGNLFCGTVSPCRYTPASLDRRAAIDFDEWILKDTVSQIEQFAQSLPISQNLSFMQKNINFAIAGVGIIPQEKSSSAKAGHSEKLSLLSLLEPLGFEVKTLRKYGAVGEFCFSFFDSKGKAIDALKLFLTPGLGFYRNLVEKKHPVMLIAGYNKRVPLLPALQTRMANVLVTDAFTANRLLEPTVSATL